MTKTVLILGAGITRAAAGSCAKKRCPPLDTDFFEIARRNFKGLTDLVLERMEGFLGDYADEVSKSLESATTYLYLKALDAKKGDPIVEAFVWHLLLLEQVLAETTNELAVTKRATIYRFLLSELQKADNNPENLTIITFNYDTLVERALQSIEQTRDGTFLFPGCYRIKGLTTSQLHSVRKLPNLAKTNLDHKGVTLLKLHGSLNWHSSHNSDKPKPSDLTNPKRELHVSTAEAIVPQLTLTRKKKVYMKPIIIPPVSGKRGILQNDIQPLWRLASNALQAADRVVIAGYSCPPLDLEARMLLSEALRKNQGKRVYVVNPDASVASRFVKLSDVDHTTVYTSLVKFVGDAKKYS